MLQQYFIYRTFVDLYYPSQVFRVFFTTRTGLVLKRKKQHPILKYVIDHKGMILGILSDGTEVVLHNHIDAGGAEVTTKQLFDKGLKSETDHKVCSNDVLSKIQIALNDVRSGRPYDELNYNCQVYVNRACSNENKSDDGARVFFGAAAVVAVAALLFAD